MPTTPKIPFREYVLMDWLSKGRRFATYGKHSHLQLRQVETVDGEPKSKVVEMGDELIELFGAEDFAPQALITRGYAGHVTSLGSSNFAAVHARVGSPNIHYSSGIFFLTPEGVAWWKAKGKVEFEHLLAERQEALKAVGRTVVISFQDAVFPVQSDLVKRAVKAGITIPNLAQSVIRPWGTATVVKETATRLYIRDPKKTANCRDHVDYRVVKGRKPNLFVEKEDVMLDHAGPGAARRLMEHDAEYVEDIQRIAQDSLERIVPILLDHKSRLAQKLGEKEDVYNELLAELREEAKARNADEAKSAPKPRA